MNIQAILATKGANVVTLGPNQIVREALATLAEYNIGALVIVDKANKPIGIVTERDIVRLAAQNEDLFSIPVNEVMTKTLITGIRQDEIRAVANTMTEKRIRHLPIVDKQGGLTGILSIRDILKAERDHYEGEADTLLTQYLADDD